MAHLAGVHKASTGRSRGQKTQRRQAPGCHSPKNPAVAIKLGAGFVPAFLLRFLAIVVWLAQWLPIAFIPEKLLVALVRCDVVNHLSSRHPGGRHVLAHHTQWMRLQEPDPRLLPCVAIAALCAAALCSAPAWLLVHAPIKAAASPWPCTEATVRSRIRWRTSPRLGRHH